MKNSLPDSLKIKHRIKTLSVLGTCLWLPFCLTVPASLLGQSASSLDLPTAEKQIRLAVQKEIDGDLFPGAVVLVGSQEQILYHEAFGYARVTPEKVKMRKDSIFDLASVTKVVATGTAFGVCVDDGLFSFEQPIHKALPELTGDGIDDITVRHLATHTSGFSNAKYHHRL